MQTPRPADTISAGRFLFSIIISNFAGEKMNKTDRQILQIAVPSIVSNVTVPLLGMIDVAIVGHMGSPVYIGAVAVGSMIFNLVYWLFGFLRMGTSGTTAQALGRRDLAEVTRILAHSATKALLIALLLIALQTPLRWLMFWLIGPTPDVAPYAASYFRIVIWGAPASLGLFALMGWFIGMQNTRIPMFISIMQNVVNIVASLCLVYGLGLRIEGVALGTVVAQYAGLLVAVGLLARFYGKVIWSRRRSIGHGSGSRGAGGAVNRDLFFRTLCLVVVNLYFTSAGARQGAVVLSVNTVLLQLYLFFSYFMDGFAYAGEALCGRHYGARNGEAFRLTLRRLFGWMAVVTAVFTACYVIGGQPIVNMLTDEPQVRLAATDYLWWAWLIPAAGCMAFIWDGVFVGLTATRGMLVSSALAALLFFALYEATHGLMGNHGLWLAQVAYLVARGLIQTWWYKKKIFLPD